MLLKLENISFEKDGKKILDNINLEIDFEKIVAITGPNGSGKSTLLKIIVGLLKPTSGKVIFHNEDFTEKSIDERCKLFMSYAFQEPVKFKGITVYDLLKLSLTTSLSRKEASIFLKKVDLDASKYLDRNIDNTLSGGELKRIEIALVLAKCTMLNLFDEPEAGIDLWSFNKLIDVFKSMKKPLTSSVIVTHQDKILKIADNIIVIKDGKVDSIGTYNEVINNV